jgi:hypothetical protein
MTVRRLLTECDSRELSEWMVYEKVAGPLGGRRGDMQAAVVAMTVANVNRGKGKPARLDDFLPEWDRPRQQDWQQQLAIVKQIHAAHGGKTRGVAA